MDDTASVRRDREYSSEATDSYSSENQEDVRDIEKQFEETFKILRDLGVDVGDRPVCEDQKAYRSR